MLTRKTIQPQQKERIMKLKKTDTYIETRTVETYTFSTFTELFNWLASDPKFMERGECAEDRRAYFSIQNPNNENEQSYGELYVYISHFSRPSFNDFCPSQETWAKSCVLARHISGKDFDPEERICLEKYFDKNDKPNDEAFEKDFGIKNFWGTVRTVTEKHTELINEKNH